MQKVAIVNSTTDTF